MGLPRITFYFVHVCLLILTILEFTPVSKSAPDYTSLVYKGCAKQELADLTGVYSQALSALFGTLIAQSSKAKFYKTTTGSGQTTINGLFQCRGDMYGVLLISPVILGRRKGPAFILPLNQQAAVAVASA
ncbi:unnamed protein product [Fraxinus pennsylvanica]|uniref:Gnk2-homologous domain-containing protein n=1 Tax=Fraxinus pennsylvanica TaxID=56036 RepID=A0AAD1ZGD3_9LAMI|nr:unnamed protein product [Fraxinus pennsylvanica]